MKEAITHPIYLSQPITTQRRRQYRPCCLPALTLPHTQPNEGRCHLIACHRHCQCTCAGPAAKLKLQHNISGYAMQAQVRKQPPKPCCNDGTVHIHMQPCLGALHQRPATRKDTNSHALDSRSQHSVPHGTQSINMQVMFASDKHIPVVNRC